MSAAAGRTLIRGATIVSMDDQVGDLVGDVLIEGDRIAAIAPSLQAADAAVVDATGHIVIPGLINVSEIAALNACADGKASPSQAKLALEWVMREACRVHIRIEPE